MGVEKLIKLFLGIIVGFLIVMLLYVFGTFLFWDFWVCMETNSNSDKYTFTTEQGDCLTLTVKTSQYAHENMLIIDEEENWIDSFEALIGLEYPSKAEKIAKENFYFVKEKGGCRYYSVCGLDYVVYTKEAPHVITKSNEWCQIRFVRNLDFEYKRHEKWRVYIVLYEHEGNTATELYGEIAVGWLEGSPEVSEKELIDSLSHVPDNYEELEEMILQSSLLEFD